MTTPLISVLAAYAKNRAMGINNTLPWHCPEDLQHFKNLTLGYPIVMGRKTFESIGKPLPGRTTIVVTRNPNLEVKGGRRAHSFDEAIDLCQGFAELFVVGGAELYEQALPWADQMYLTEIQQEVEGDTYFPKFNKLDWQEVYREICH